MARPKKDATKEVAQLDVSEKVVTDVTQELLKKLEEMEKQIQELKSENQALKNDTEETIEELNGDTEIEVISQFVGTLALSTDGNGMGTVYRFEKFGEVQDIPFSDLKDIVKNKPSFAKEGLFYISNKEAVKKLRLTKEYEHIVNSDIFAHLLDEKSVVIIKAYENAPSLQKEQIVSMIDERLARNQEVDGNVLVKIGKLCGKDFLRVDEDE